MILRKAKHLSEGDKVRLKHERYPSALFEVVSVQSTTTIRLGLCIAVKFKQLNVDFGPTEYLKPNDLVEMILE